MVKGITGTSATICIDLGSSLTKVVWSLDCSEENNFLTMEPEIMQCNDQHLDIYRSRRINLYNATKDDAWVKLEDNEYSFAIGFLASGLLAEANLKALKYESALYKIMAVLGVIAEQVKPQMKSLVPINLTTLLPRSEWNDQSKLKEQIQNAAKSFWFRGQRMRLRIRDCRCLPEGAGITLNRYTSLTQSTATIITLVFGHRNTSILIFQRGRLIEGDTTNLGFHRLIDRIVELTSGQSRKQLNKIVSQLGDPIDTDNPLLSQLCMSQLAENQQREREEIIEAIRTAQQYYWELISQWLLAKAPRQINEVVIAGGAGKYLYNRLQERFCNVPTYWGTDWQELIENSPQFQELDLHEECRGILAFRLVDAYAAHYYQSKGIQHSQAQEPVSSLV
ncbi:MAG: ParM/StbA family protein [Okeania sp. SIO3B5]|uniref:ParM/StbA family protein n=1 Tax=Okeania sp. SIO3B5 TaxID=2607811 RepID=UPI0013FED266|nr:ParM/StbA family protein [Okeania sp. SIO3B5]NEO52560.1 ParM/StbA family protein [Okeania sp. SIO3B5]